MEAEVGAGPGVREGPAPWLCAPYTQPRAYRQARGGGHWRRAGSIPLSLEAESSPRPSVYPGQKRSLYFRGIDWGHAWN